MLLWIIALTIILLATAVLGYLVATMMVPAILDAFVAGDVISALLMGLVTIAMVLIGGLAVAGCLRGHYEAVRQRVAESSLATRRRRRRLESAATSSPEPVLGVKLARVHWDDPAVEPQFAGASGGNPYARDDVAHCGDRPATSLCVDQRTDHRCGFYAVPSRSELLAELVAHPAPDRADWSLALQPFEPTTHVVTVALHGQVIGYDRALRGQRQTVTAIDVPAACGSEGCDAPLDAVAALGHPVGLCGLHAASLAGHTLAVAEFERRFNIAVRPTTSTGDPVDRPDLRRPSATTAPERLDQPTPDTPMDRQAERVEGWLAGSYDLRLGQFVTEQVRLGAETQLEEPIVANRDAPTPPSGQALARVRLGGEVVVRRHSVASRDIQMWDLYLPAQCQQAGCEQPAALVDADGPLAVARCRVHASEQARPAEHHSAAHGVAIQLGR